MRVRLRHPDVRQTCSTEQPRPLDSTHSPQMPAWPNSELQNWPVPQSPWELQILTPPAAVVVVVAAVVVAVWELCATEGLGATALSIGFDATKSLPLPKLDCLSRSQSR